MNEGKVKDINHYNLDDYLTKKQASKALGVSIKTVENWAKAGKLPPTKVKNSRGQTQSLYHISDIQRCQSVKPVAIKEELPILSESFSDVEAKVQDCIEISTTELNVHTQALAALLQKQNELIMHLSEQISTIPKQTSQQVGENFKGAINEINTNNEQTLFAIGQLVEQDKYDRQLERQEDALSRERLELKREERDIEITNIMKQAMATKEKSRLSNRLKSLFATAEKDDSKRLETEQLKEQLMAESRTRARAKNRSVAKAKEPVLSLDR